jgi:hypothetical protein
MMSKRSLTTPLQAHLDQAIDDVIDSLPKPELLGPNERRGIIARYTAVLEGNFIYWMTAAYLSAVSEEAKSVIQENLLEEVRDSHPDMLRKFAASACAVPTDSDALAVYRNLQNVRLFVGRLEGVKIVLTMAFFEGFIVKFMPYLAELARKQGSAEQEYTDVHGTCDLVHTEELFRALEAEMTLMHDRLPPTSELLEGVNVLGRLIESIIHPSRPTHFRTDPML